MDLTTIIVDVVLDLKHLISLPIAHFNVDVQDQDIVIIAIAISQAHMVAVAGN